MKVRLPGQRLLATLVLASLAALTMLSSQGGVPEVPISDLERMDEGASVSVIGVIVDAWSTESGSRSLILADLGSDSTVKVVYASADPDGRLNCRIGDEARAMGELEVTGGRPTIWANGDGITVVRVSRDVISVGLLAIRWDLLIRDRFEIRGVLAADPDGGYRLMDMDASTSIAMSAIPDGIARYEWSSVVVEGTLRFDSSTMNLVLEVHSISAED